VHNKPNNNVNVPTRWINIVIIIRSVVGFWIEIDRLDIVRMLSVDASNLDVVVVDGK
jgi:hypothetical protein